MFLKHVLYMLWTLSVYQLLHQSGFIKFWTLDVFAQLLVTTNKNTMLIIASFLALFSLQIFYLRFYFYSFIIKKAFMCPFSKVAAL